MARRRDYLPQSEAEFAEWVENYHTQFSALATSLGFTAAEVTELSSAKTVWVEEYAAFREGRDLAKAARARKSDAKASLRTIVRRQVKRLQASPVTTDATRAQLRVTIPATTRSAVGQPTETPNMRLYFGDRGRIRIHFGPNPANENANGLPAGVYGVAIEYAESSILAEENVWTHLANRSASPHVHIVETATPKTFAYRCRYVNRRGEGGPWSAPIVGTITP